MRRRVTAPACTALALSLALCTGAACRHGGAAGNTELVVFAAASLREAFLHLAHALEAEHPGTRVVLNLAGSQDLRLQIENGARADVVAVADSSHMAALAVHGLVGAASIFATNELAIAVPRGNPARIRTIADLAHAQRIVLADRSVPAGRYTAQLLDAAELRSAGGLRSRIEANVISRELNVRQVLAKIALREGDAAIVYRSDGAASDAVELVAIPAELNVQASYPIAVAAATGHPDLARAFVELTLSPRGQAILAAAGFASP